RLGQSLSQTGLAAGGNVSRIKHDPVRQFRFEIAQSNVEGQEPVQIDQLVPQSSIQVSRFAQIGHETQDAGGAVLILDQCGCVA
ncbi:MAG: hypothetical protein ACKVKF_06115, partial [Rhodobacterales bacterium]